MDAADQRTLEANVAEMDGLLRDCSSHRLKKDSTRPQILLNGTRNRTLRVLKGPIGCLRRSLQGRPMVPCRALKGPIGP